MQNKIDNLNEKLNDYIENFIKNNNQTLESNDNFIPLSQPGLGTIQFWINSFSSDKEYYLIKLGDVHLRLYNRDLLIDDDLSFLTFRKKS